VGEEAIGGSSESNRILSGRRLGRSLALPNPLALKRLGEYLHTPLAIPPREVKFRNPITNGGWETVVKRSGIPTRLTRKRKEKVIATGLDETKKESNIPDPTTVVDVEVRAKEMRIQMRSTV